MYKQGAIYGVIVLAIAFVAGLIANQIGGEQWAEIIIGLSVLIAWGIVGYLYRKKIGPMFFSEDGKAVIRLMKFGIGVGVVWGPAKLYLSNFPVPDVLPIWNLLLAILAIPLAGLSVVGVLVIGGWFYRGS